MKNFLRGPNFANRGTALSLATAALITSGVFIERVDSQPAQSDLQKSVSKALRDVANLKDCTPPQPLGEGPVPDRLKILFPEMAGTSAQQLEALKQSAAQIEASEPGGKTPADTLVEACDATTTTDISRFVVAFVVDPN